MLDIHWVIAHPGTLEPIKVESFEKAMNDWFEGYNIPRLCIGGIFEPFRVSNRRVQKYLNKGKGKHEVRYEVR